MQRLFDLLFVVPTLLIFSPILLLICLVLRLTGEGKIFFFQNRVGLGGNTFKVYKFATMLENSPNMGTMTVTLKDDPRVLPVGRLLRKTKLNEIPQLLNVVFGDMSLIGPRPQTQRCFDAFAQDAQADIITVPPGLSGIGSIVFRNEEEMMNSAEDSDRFYDDVIMPYKGHLEQWYVENRTLRTYFACIFITIWAVISSQATMIWSTFPDLPKPPEDLKKYF